MSNQELFISGYLDKIATKFNINKDDAFEVFSIAAVLETTFEDIYNNVIIKGSQDGGIDGIYFLEQGDYYVMHVFQCKNSPSLKQNAIDKFRSDYDDIFINGNRVQKPNIEDLKPKIDEYKQLSASGYIIEYKLYFLYNGLNNDATKSGNIQNFDSYHKEGHFEIWDSKNLYQKISSLIKSQNRRENIKYSFTPVNSNIALSDNQALYSFSIQNIRAANFRISAIDLCQLIEVEKQANATYDFLFSDNIRGFLGLRVRANKKMQLTLNNSEEAIYFPFLNNGITIICDKLTLPNSPQNGEYVIPAFNPVIVNGLQTTRVIYEQYQKQPSSIENIFVNVRLYESDDSDLVDKITDATNTQTPINFRDKVSNKDFNTYTKELFELDNIAYITKRGEAFSNQLSREMNDTVNSDTVLKFWYACYFEKPEMAKNSIARVLEEIYDATNTESPLSKLFSGDKHSVIYLQLLRTYKIYKKVQQQKYLYKKDEQFVVHADELLSYGVYKILEQNLAAIEDDLKLNSAYDEAFKVIKNTIETDIKRHTKAGKAFSFSSYFKRPKCRDDYNLKANIIESECLIEELIKK
ncbi:MAG: hypothetical protein GQ569_14470 [Methylococcaceae bacterium]|nr:hypothetical protein [Methylococcaceae bacterium]